MKPLPLDQEKLDSKLKYRERLALRILYLMLTIVSPVRWSHDWNDFYKDLIAERD